MIKSPAKPGLNPHIPIMVKEVIQYLQVSKNGTYMDCTIGYGGHAVHILEKLSSNGKLIGIDKDEEAIKFCKKSLSNYSNIQLFHNSYHNIKDILSISKTHQVDGMLLDLGLSAAQLDSQSRGFSYRIDSELDMRFDLNQKLKANDILNIKSKKELADIIFKYSDERRSRAIAENILKMRPIKNVYELVDWLQRSNDLPDVAVLMTGTGIIPPQDFTLKENDIVEIQIEKIGVLRNKIVLV